MRDLGRLVLTLLLCPNAVEAQLWVDAGYGRSSHDGVASRIEADNVVIGLRRAGDHWFEAVAGVPFGSGAEAPWGSAAVGGEWVRRGTNVVGVGGGAQVYGYSRGSRTDASSGWGSVVELTPVARAERGPLRVELRAGPILTWADSPREREFRVVHSGWLVADYGLSGGDAGVQGIARLVRAEGETYPLIGATASLDRPGGGLWVQSAKWISSSVEDPEWSIGAYWNAAPRLQVYGSVQRETNDPVYRPLPNRTFTIGASFAMSRPARISSGTGPIEVTTGQVAFRIARDGATSAPAIAGDFTGWNAQPLSAEGDHWVARFALPSGLYRFSFVDAAGEWFLPSTIVHRVADAFGGENGVIVVP